MSSPSKVPYQFDPGTKILSDQVDANFQFCLDYTYDLLPTLTQSVNYLAYGINLDFDNSNYKIELDLSLNLLHFNSIGFTRNSIGVAPSSTGPVVFQPNIPRITDLGILIDFGATNYVERYQDYPIFAPKIAATNSTQTLVDKSAVLLAAGFDYFPSGKVFCIDNTPDAGSSYTLNIDCSPTLVIGQTYEFSAIMWADTGTVRLGVTGGGVPEITQTNTTPKLFSSTFVCNGAGQAIYLKASASSKVYGIGFYLGPVTNQKVPAYAMYDNSYLGTDANNLLLGVGVDPNSTTGIINSSGTATLAVATDTASTLLKSIITPGKTTNNVIRIDNSASAITAKLILDQPALTVGLPYSFVVYARIVSGTGGKIRGDNASPLADITLVNGNLWNRYTGTFTPTNNQNKLFIQPDAGAVIDICACYITQASSLAQPLLPYHLGTTTTQDDNLTWKPNLTVSPVIAEWGNSFQTEIDFVKGDTVQLGINSKGPWIGQTFKAVRSLMPGESIKTYTSPADATLLKSLWNYNYTGTVYDPKTAYTVLDFEDNFTVLSVGEATDVPTTTRKWFANVHTPFGYITSFVSPAQQAILGTNTWYCDGTNLRIRLEKQASNYYGGLMCSVNTAGQGYRCPQFFYLEARVQFPPFAKFPWSAIWFKNPDPVESQQTPYIEFDLAEIYSSDSTYWHSTWFIHTGFNPDPNGPQTDQFASDLYRINLVDGNFHTLGLEVNAQWIITYVDGYEARRIPYYAEWRLHNAYILVNITGLSGEQGLFVSPADYFIDYIRVYRKP